MKGIAEEQMTILIEPLMCQMNSGNDSGSQCKYHDTHTVDFCVSCDILHIKIRLLLSK